MVVYSCRYTWHMGPVPLPDRELMRLQYVKPEDIGQYWPEVRKGLEHILSRSNELWIPEDVYVELKNINCGLYVFDGGFVILQITSGWSGKDCNVFAAYGSGNMDWAFEETKQIARDLGCRRLKFMTTRDGWEKAAIKLGYTKRHVEYDFDLNSN